MKDEGGRMKITRENANSISSFILPPSSFYWSVSHTCTLTHRITPMAQPLITRDSDRLPLGTFFAV